MSTVRLTTAQALVRFLANQYVERDGTEQRFFAGCFGIFGHDSLDTTMVYVRGTQGDLQQAVEEREPGLRVLDMKDEIAKTTDS